MRVIHDLTDNLDKMLPKKDSKNITNNTYEWLIRHYEKNAYVLASIFNKFHGTIR